MDAQLLKRLVIQIGLPAIAGFLARYGVDNAHAQDLITTGVEFVGALGAVLIAVYHHAKTTKPE